MTKTVLVTGGAGFIGSALVLHLVAHTNWKVVNLDKMTYAANPASLAGLAGHSRYRFEQVDLCDGEAVAGVFARHAPDIVMHLAAESHVDRSIDGPGDFVNTNILGTFRLLEAARGHYLTLDVAGRQAFRFLHVSTDEVFGSLGDDGFFREDTPYSPNSPYSASKAASDHLARAWGETYGLPVLVSNCSNNYGPRQFPEKLIPLMILKALRGEPLPVYGEGLNVRDWLFVEDHARALHLIVEQGVVGQSYNIGGQAERRNIDVVHTLCAILDDLRPRADGQPHTSAIAHVRDRPGHDHRYAIDISKIQRELGWAPSVTFEAGLRQTVQWYLDNEAWWRPILEGRYQTERLGLETLMVAS